MKVRSNEREAIKNGEITGEILQQQIDWLFDTKFAGVDIWMEAHLIGDIDDRHTAIFQHLDLVVHTFPLPAELPSQPDYRLGRRIRLNDDGTYGYNHYTVNGRGLKFLPGGRVREVIENTVEDKIDRTGPLLSSEEIAELFTGLDSNLGTYQNEQRRLAWDEGLLRSTGKRIGKVLGRTR